MVRERSFVFESESRIASPSAWIARLAHDRDDQSHLRVDAAESVNAGHSADREHVGRGAHVHATLAREVEHIVGSSAS